MRYNNVMPTSPAGFDQRRLLSQFNIAFSLMTIIPLLTCAWLITVRFFSIAILVGMNGVYFLLVLVIALLGLLAGQQLIRRIVHQLVETNAKLDRLNQQQAAFVSNVAHELRSPLAIFKGTMDNLADGLHGALTPDQMEPVAMSQKEINRLSRLVSDLLDLARIEAGKLQLQQQDVDLQELLTMVVQLFRGPAKQRGLALSAELPQAPAKLLGDRDRLQQVFVNLVANAIKYSDAGGIRLRLANDGEMFRVEVQDTGRGIAPGDLERVFDKFERVGVQTEEGSGLGLPIARDIVELHRGRLWAESEPGQGSCFIVTLPMKHSSNA